MQSLESPTPVSTGFSPACFLMDMRKIQRHTEELDFLGGDATHSILFQPTLEQLVNLYRSSLVPGGPQGLGGISGETRCLLIPERA